MIIKVKNLKLQTILGIYNWEKEKPRDVVINLSMEIDPEPVLNSNNIEDTIDYHAVGMLIKDLLDGNDFDLVEDLANQILNLVMQDERITTAEIEVDKPKAFDLADSVSVTLVRHKNAT
jgi:FolB domain-containing protein